MGMKGRPMIPWTAEDICRKFPQARILTPLEIQDWLPQQRTSASHKYTNGTLLALVGSRAYPGAALLSLRAAARVGAGVVRALVPPCVWPLIPVTVPEVIPVEIPCDAKILADLKVHAQALLVGCGIGRGDSAQNQARDLLNTPVPLVIDGDGLYALRALSDKTCARLSQGRWLLTPHGGELNRLIPDLPQDNLDFIKNVQDKAIAWQCTFLIKGFPGIIVSYAGDIFICPPGNPAATTAGCGDVLAGACAGYLAQGASPVQAAALGSWDVAKATQDFLNHTHARTLMASDVVDWLNHS